LALHWLVGELKTGRVTGSLPLVDSSWSIVMDDAGTMSGTLTMASPDVQRLNPRASAEPGRCFLAAVWSGPSGDDVILDAGPIWTWNYSGSDKRLRIGAAGLWSYYDHRKVLGVLTSVGGAPAVTYTTGPTSLGTVAKRLVALAHTHTNGSLPIVLPDDVTGTETRSYPGSELGWVGQKLRELTQEDAGPEIAFVPRFLGSDERFIEWVMQVGTPDEPLLVQSGSDWTWDMSVPASNVADFNVDIDGTGLASRAWAAGAASGENRLIEYRDDTTLTASGWPLLEVETDATDTVTTAAQLASLARQAVTAARLPVESWTLTAKTRSEPTPGKVRPGHWARVHLGDAHPLLGGGEYRGRITQVSGGDGESMQLQFQPEPGVAAQPVAVIVETPAVPEEPEVPDPETPEPVPPEEPEAPPEPDPPAPGDEITWLSGVFVNHEATKVVPFGTFRDRPVSVVALFPTWNTQAAIANTWYLGSSYLPPGYTGAVALAMPMCSAGNTVSQDISAQITTTANALRDYGDNVWYIRLGWEMNLPQWPWAVNDARLSTWRAKWSTYYGIFKSILGSKAVMTLNPNIGPPQSGLTGSISQVWVDGKVDCAGPDAYDCWPPFTSPANIDAQLNDDQHLNWWANLCRTKGADLCLPEWGVSSGTQWAGNCGNDNPDYIDAMVDWMIDNDDIMAFDAYFNEPASYVRSEIFPASTTVNPDASAQYVARFATP
jgi:hypothetical protein